MDAFRDNALSRVIRLIMNDFGLYFSISLGVFIFILFFQPFPIDSFDFNNSLLVTAGMAVIVLFTIIFVRNILPSFFRHRPEPSLPLFTDSAIILIFSTVAFAFYLRYVGSVSISFYIMSKVFFICLVPPVVIRIFDFIRDMKKLNESLLTEKGEIQKQVDKYEEDYLNKTLDFIPEGSGESMSLLLSDIAIVKSADNYVEIVYVEDKIFKRKLLRSTLKNVEQMLKPYGNFIRCHRICIVNTLFIEKLNRKFNNNWLTIRGYDEQIPVSRQYILKIREAL